MKRDGLGWQLLVGLVFFSVHQVSIAKEYSVDEGHSNVGFTVSHLFSKLNGAFKKFEGKFSFDAAKPEASKVTAEVQVASIDTNEAKRDGHLKGDDFFSATKFPKLTFVSKKFTADGDKKFKMEGDLTMRGVTKPVTFDVEFLGEGDDAWGGHRAGFTAVSKIDRKDFGINWNKTLDKGGVMVGDNVTISLNVEGMEVKGKK
jgi:polyisoprenoid-binding protein YceI